MVSSRLTPDGFSTTPMKRFVSGCDAWERIEAMVEKNATGLMDRSLALGHVAFQSNYLKSTFCIIISGLYNS